jgi:PhzF family phenazine biosynthesis protein
MVAFPVAPHGTRGGNPAGVVLEPPDMTAEEMTRLAVRLNPVSETAYVQPPREGAYRLRYFAPGGEVDLCGHATLAAFGALAAAGRLGELPAAVRSVAPGGVVGGRVGREGEGVVVWLDMPVARRVGPLPEPERLAVALGLPAEVLASRPAGAIEDVGIRIALVPVADLAALDAMRPDFHALRALGGPHGITVFYAFVLDRDGQRVRARSFAPAVGIDEDPATGTASAALGAFLARERLLPPPPTASLRVRQGEAMGRPSEIRLHVEHHDGEVRAVRVGGWVHGRPVEE